MLKSTLKTYPALILLIWISACHQPEKEFIFHTPAFQGEKDLENASGNTKEDFFRLWDMYVNRATITAANYNLSGGMDYTVPGNYYINPKDDPSIMKKGKRVPVKWQAFPNRILYYMESKFIARYGDEKGRMRMYQLVDIGPEAYQEKYHDSIVFIPQSACDPNPQELKMLDPYGPRGWLEEYCEMGIRKNSNCEIIQLHFTCENPEYFWALWSVDPKEVLRIYQETLGNPNIAMEDLYLRDSLGKPVIVKETGRPAYNPINKWNHGTNMTDTYGGAIHLTSPPNELSAEITLAGGGAVLRNDNPELLNVANSLICCSQYGLRFRHSDPHIGQNVYQVVQQNIKVTLLDPVGLYLQEPAYQYFTLPENAPAGASIKDCFRFVRGEVHPKDFPNNMILHMIMEVPESWDSTITLSDFKVMGRPLQYGSQVMETIEVQLVAAGIPSDTAAHTYDCPTPNEVPGVTYLTNYNLLMASLQKGFADSANVTSNTLQVPKGEIIDSIALVVSNIQVSDIQQLKISFPGSDIKVVGVKYVGSPAKYSQTGALNDNYTYLLKLSVPQSAKSGAYDIMVYNKNNGQGIPVPKIIQIVEPHQSNNPSM